MIELDFLDKSAIINGNLKDVNSKNYVCKMTDFASILGVGYDCNRFKSEEEMFLSSYWTKTPTYWGVIISNYSYNSPTFFGIDIRNIYQGIRPIVRYSDIKPYIKNIYQHDTKTIIEFGEYPQSLINISTVEKMALEKRYKNGKLKKTGRCYTTNSAVSQNENLSHFEDLKLFIPTINEEYEIYYGKYIRYICTIDDKNSPFKIKKGEVYWIQVEPIYWLVDEENDLAISEKVLFGGIPFDVRDKYTGDFENTFMKYFLDHIFLKEIIGEKVDSKLFQMDDVVKDTRSKIKIK